MFLFHIIGVSGNVVPSTYKQKKTAVTAPPKAEGDEDKAAAVGEAAPVEGETPAGPMGRGAR